MNMHEPIDGNHTFIQWCLKTKYAYQGETTAEEIISRVANGLAETDEENTRYRHAMEAGFIPGGRIMSSAGTNRQTTLINCFVQPVADTVSGHDANGNPGIFVALQEAAETMRRGGGVGYDFSPIRPNGARVKGTDSRASGPVSYMAVFDRMCQTVESAGARRGAQMGILRVDHPDIEEFISAKTAPSLRAMGLNAEEEATMASVITKNDGFAYSFRSAFARLSNFNISVTVTDSFMQALEADEEFDLVHEAEPAGEHLGVKTVNGKTAYIYRRVRARALWDRIMRNNYQFAEPGVIFIDRVNQMNNLRYAEEINASNPCGEQMLPAYGCCDLGSPDLGRFVRDAFTPDASFDFEGLAKAAAVGVEILDRVLDKTHWPLPAQATEAQNKRRIGMGFTGLADALAMMGVRYGSPEGAALAASMVQCICHAAYRASIELAKKHGPFPFFDAKEYLAEGTFASTLPEDIRKDIAEFGIRNSHLMSVAPTGTISIAFGDNASGGIEPVFSHEYQRNFIDTDGVRKPAMMLSRVLQGLNRLGMELDEHGIHATSQQLTVNEHLGMMTAVAPYIDAAISKTINVPESYSFEDFADVYRKAYHGGLKGITTYRPNKGMNAVLVAKTEATAESELPKQEEPSRQVALQPVQALTEALQRSRPKTPHGVDGRCYQIKHSAGDFAVMVTHSDDSNAPLDVYVASAEQPRGIAAVAMVLSLDLRAMDPGWTVMKLDSLSRTKGDDAFDLVHPATGDLIKAPSLVAGFTMVVRHRLQELGVLEPVVPSPMMNSLFSAKEPKVGPEGGTSWHVDIYNPATGDDFVMFVKEKVMPDGARRPFSVWLTGEIPSVLVGLTKLLSIDMRVSDPQWVIKKLRKLLTFGENRGDFFAVVPGEKRQQNYPSTVAYMAAVLLSRYENLGLMGMVQAAPEHITAGTGKLCPSCKTPNLHKRDGCEVCDACGHLGSCG